MDFYLTTSASPFPCFQITWNDGLCRSSVQESTGFSPYHFMFEREINLPADVMFGSTPDQRPDTLYKYVEGPQENLEKAHMNT